MRPARGQCHRTRRRPWPCVRVLPTSPWSAPLPSDPPLSQAQYVEISPARHTVFSGQYTVAPAACQRVFPRLLLYRRGMSLLPDHAQTLQSQVTVDLLNALRNIAHLLGEAARRDHLHVAVELASHALHQAVHEPCIPVDDTGLDVGYRVAADRLFRPHELDPIEPGRLRDQRL